MNLRLAPLFSREAELNAFVHTLPDELDRISTADGPLAGRAVAVKDNIAVVGAPWACGSATRVQRGPARTDAEVVRRVRAAGGRIVGTTNMDELAMGASTESSMHGPSRNPWDPGRVPGGSSGGSAAAVAAYGVLALGTDTGGSIREPAAFCGVVGVAPSPDSIPMDDVVEFAPSMDRVGPMAPTVAEAALLHEVIGGRTGLIAAAERGRTGDLAGRTIGVIVPMSGDRNAPEVRDRLDAVRRSVAGLGADLVPVDVPRFGDLLETYVTLSSVEALPVLTEHAGRGPLGPEAARRLDLARGVLGTATHDDAVATRQRIRADMQAAFGRCEVMLSPTAPLVAPVFGRLGLDDPEARPRTDWWTVEANLAGLPAISLPAGSGAGLPVGVQLLAPNGRDDLLYQYAAAIEVATAPPSWGLTGE